MIRLKRKSNGNWVAILRGDSYGSPFESEIDEWFQEMYSALGFSKIEPPNGAGDYIGWKLGRKFVIELEQTTSQYFLHKKEIRDKMDIIICWRKCTPQKIGKNGTQGIEALNKLLELYSKEIIEIRNYFDLE